VDAVDMLGEERTTSRADAPHDVGEAEPASRPPRADRRLLTALLVAVNLPIVVATVRALSAGWQPMGDNGILLVRARDVGTSHHPLLGTWTSASLLFEVDLNNPGPLYFDVLALPVRVLGPWVGLAVGVMLVNMAASSFAVVVGRRITGNESMVAVALAVVALQFAMGSELLYDVWQPNALVLPFFAFLVAAVVLASGQVTMAPWVVGIGSLVVQTHFSHAVLVGTLTLAAAVACAVVVRRSGDDVPLRRPLVWTGVVALVAWIQPLIEQFTGPGDGNISRILDAGTAGDATPIGWDRAPRVLSEIMVRGPWFNRDTYAHALPVPPIGPDSPAYGTLTSGPTFVALGLLVAVLLGAAVWGARRGRRGLAAMGGVAALALLATIAALATSPVNLIGIVVHQMRWVWPVAALVTAALLTAGLSLLRSRPRAQAPLLALCGLVAAAVAIANLPTYVSTSEGPTDSPHLLAGGQELVSQLEALEGRGTVLYDPTDLRFGEPYSGMTFAEMQDRGIPFVFDDEGFIRQFGEGRRHEGDADLRMWQVEGDDAEDVPPGVERVAYIDTPDGPVALFVEPID
jgi:hypothetical protein